MIRFKTLFQAVLLVHLLAALAFAGWTDTLNTVKDVVGSPSTSSTTTGGSLTTSEIVSGLKTALDKAVDTATSSLGTEDGFLGNLDVKIPVPDSFAKVETALRLIGQSDLADSFVTSMNRAAEKAVPETVEILTEAITNMSFDDAKGILNGGDTAATDFFRNTADGALLTRLEPIVSEAMDSVNVTQYFKNMMSAAQATGVAGPDFDLDGYVTRKALDGLYFIMEKEEANIRQNPVARTSEILKKVFGSI